MSMIEFVNKASGARVTVAAGSKSAAHLNRRPNWTCVTTQDVQPVQEEATETPPVAPPMVGAGSSRDAWADYAEHLGYHTVGLSRAEIIEQIDG